jgi:hypothetical protein
VILKEFLPMRPFDENSWKKKIDPAFDDLIKVHLDNIERTHVCSIDKRKRYLTLDEESLKALESEEYPPLLREINPNLTSLNELMDDVLISGPSSNSKIVSESLKYLLTLFDNNENKKIKRSTKSKYAKALISNIISMIKGLPREDSRNYYKNSIGIIIPPEGAKPSAKGEVQNKLILSNEMLVDILCLIYQTGFSGYFDSQSESHTDKIGIDLNHIHIVMQQIYYDLSVITYKKTLKKLIKEARNNDESLYKAIHLDKTLFDEDWIRKRIRKAFYSGDSAFFTDLGNAIIKPPIPLKEVDIKLNEIDEVLTMEYGKLTLILSKLWPFGLYRLQIRELAGLLESCGLTIQEDIATFRTYVNRLRNANVLRDINRGMTDKKGQT